MLGKTIINDEVFIELARSSMMKVNEVILQERKGTLSGLAQIFTERFIPQVSVKKTPADSGEGTTGAVSFDLKLAVLYGVNIPEVVGRVRDTVAQEVEITTGYKVECIDITIDKLIKPENQVSESKQ